MKEFEANVSYKDTIKFIKKAHAGQKYGSMPYWKHPQEVAETGRKIFGSKFDEDCMIASALHDVIEDTEYNKDILSSIGYTDKVLDAVELVTKERSLSYEGNISRIVNSGNHIAMMVKFSDNYMNYHGDKSDWNPVKREKSQAKYLKSMQTLGSKLGISVNSDGTVK